MGLRPFVWVWLVVVGLGSSGVGTAAAQSPPDPRVELSPADRLALARGLEARRLAAAVLPGIWPGFDAGKIPLLLSRYGQLAILIGHPDPLDEYRPLEPGRDDGVPVHVFEGEDQRLRGGRVVSLGEVITAVHELAPAEPADTAEAAEALATAPITGHPPAEEAIAAMIGAMFRAYAAARFRLPPGSPGKHPDSPQALAWANLESRLLLRGATASAADGVRSAARLFVAVRRARWGEIGDELAAAEAFDEFHEGLATYTELEALRLAPGTGSPPSAPILDDATFAGYRYAGMMRQEALAELLTLLEDPGQMRDRRPLTGAIQALLLDRLDPSWRGRAFDPPTTLVQLLAGACGFRPEDAPELLRRAEADPADAGLLALAQEDYRRIARRREAVLKRFMERPGIRVRLHVPAGDVRNYRYDPQSLADPGGPRLIHEGFLDVDVVGGHVRIDGAPAMTVYGISPPDIREVWFVVSEDASFSLDNSIFYPRLGSMNASQEIRIEAPGVLLEGGPCHLYMSGRTVEVTFSSRPARGTARGTP